MDYILDVKHLKKHFPIKKGVLKRITGYVHAVNEVSFKIKKGESLGLVGESGCGKTTLGKCVLYLQKPTEGAVVFDGIDLSKLPEADLRRIRPKFQMIFQDPYSTLNPRMSIQSMLNEPLKLYETMRPSQRRERVLELLNIVGLKAEQCSRYPHELSGGQRQRLAIARALALNPSLIVCDEPVSALDVSIQAQVLNLLERLKDKFGLSFLFISHDIGVVEHTSDRIAVMYLGKIVELARDTEICSNPQHPYTKALMAAIPIPKARSRKTTHQLLAGDVPNPIKLPTGCPFHPRCIEALPHCRDEEPSMVRLDENREVACHLFN